MDDKSARKRRGSDPPAAPVETVSEPPPPEPPACGVPRASTSGSAEILPLPAGRLGRSRARQAPRVRVEDHISRQLRALYQDVVAQPVPDRFVELLSQLEAGGAKKPAGREGE